MKFELFILLYSFMKLLRMMMASTVLMTVALAVWRIAGDRNWRVCLTMFCLVPFSCLMGYSKIFFRGKLLILTNWIQGYVTEQMAVLYFAVSGILAVRYLYLQGGLRRQLRWMQRLRAKETDAALQGRGPRIRVYLSRTCSSPYAGGIFRPYIVIPQTFWEHLSTEQFSAVLYHEALHIRQGHIHLLHIYAWLKIFWWMHPLIYVLEHKLRENIEYGSDEGSVMLGPLSACEYAGMILKTLRMGQRTGWVRAGTAAFHDSSYALVKKRLERLGRLGQSSTRRSYQKKNRIFLGLTVAAAVLLTAVMTGTSMPRYTRIKEISAYDEKLRPLTMDLKKEGFRAEVRSHGFYISAQEMQRFAREHQLHGEYVIFSYDTIMKVPGIGGFGQAARVRIQDPSDVFLLARQEWTDQLQAFVMKYLI